MRTILCVYLRMTHFPPALIVVALTLVGCAMLQPHAQVRLSPATQPAGKINAGVMAPVGGAVSAAISANREVGSNTAGAGSTAYTFVNSAWPTVVFGLGCGVLLILRQREKGAHWRTRTGHSSARLGQRNGPMTLR